MLVSGSCSSTGTSRVEFLSWEGEQLPQWVSLWRHFDHNILLISVNACPVKHGSVGLSLPAAEEEVNLCNFLALHFFEFAQLPSQDCKVPGPRACQFWNLLNVRSNLSFHFKKYKVPWLFACRENGAIPSQSNLGAIIFLGIRWEREWDVTISFSCNKMRHGAFNYTN